jgi:uncharacterized membrane protein
MQASLHTDRHGFRLRGTEPSRVDNFSDVVFGFALTLIVVSQAVPHTYDELVEVLRGFVPFASCFLLFISIWLAHYRFSRAFGLHDVVILWLNFAQLFMVLLFVYPLKFLFAFATSDSASVFSSPEQQTHLMIIYGAGYAAIELLYAAMYGRAWQRRRHLRLNPLEECITASNFWNYIGIASVGLICCAIAHFLPPNRSGRAGYGFFLLIVWGRIHAFVSKRRFRDARARTTPEELTALPHTS